MYRNVVYLYVLSCTFCSVYSWFFDEGKTSKQPNIVYILADDVGWNDVGWHNSKIHTPHLNKLAYGGIRLNHSYVQSTCTPSRAAVLAGRYPYRLGLQRGAIEAGFPYGLPLGVKLLPEELQKLGYATHMIGKWHLGFCNWKYTPTYRGFDSFYGFYNGHEDHYTHHIHGYLDFHMNKKPVRDLNGTYSTDAFSKRARQIIGHHDKRKPLFLYLAFQSAHAPLQAPKKFIKKNKHISSKHRRIFSGMVEAMDDAVGNLMFTLKWYGLMDNTIVVFTSDNGGAIYSGGNNWPLRGNKATLWEGGSRVPAFIYSKRFNKKGFTYNGLVHAVDWYPTLLAAAGGTPSDHTIDGQNLWEAILKNGESPRSEFIYNINEKAGHAAIRVGRYKLIEGSPGIHNLWYYPDVKGLRKAYKKELERNKVRKHYNKWLKFFEGLFNGKESSSEEYISQKKLKNRTKMKQYLLFDIVSDPQERFNIARFNPGIVENMKEILERYKTKLKPGMKGKHDPKSDPYFWGGVWHPGWC